MEKLSVFMHVELEKLPLDKNIIFLEQQVISIQQQPCLSMKPDRNQRNKLIGKENVSALRTTSATLSELNLNNWLANSVCQCLSVNGIGWPWPSSEIETH